MGHALRFPRYQACPKCGTSLVIIEDGKYVGTGFSPFTAKKIKIKSKDTTHKIKKHSKGNDKIKQGLDE
jgi:hypothetical protein